MKHNRRILALLPLLAIGCAPTRIVTVTPSTSYSSVYTTVTAPMTKTVTKTEVYAVDEDICLQLDLQAVAAAFAQSSTIQEFESLLNNSSYMLSNLDLNRDGYVDYLRVLETVDRGTHVFVIQAVLGANIYQDVATLIAEVQSVTNYHVQVVGAPYIYGPDYIIQPIFISRPIIFTHLVRPSYNPWRSPWYWSHFPTYYKHPAPIHLNHYMAYVDTYMRNHRYCHSFEYAVVCHYPNYTVLSKPYQRNDYGAQHPEMSFGSRTAKMRVSSTTTSGGSSAAPARVVKNARDVAENRKASSVTTVTPSRSASSASRTSSSSTATTPSRSASSSSSSASTSTATPSRSTATATPSRSTTSSSSKSSTTAATPSRSTATATPSRSTTSSSSKSSASSGSQTTRSRVTSSGSSSTKISTTSPSGSSSTVSRTRTSTSSSSPARSSSSTSTGSSSSSTRTSSAASATRSSAARR